MRLVVLISGGLDSYIAYRYGKTLYDNVVPMFINYNQPYLEKEKKSISNLSINPINITCDLCSEELENIPTIKNQEIYGRNLLLCFYGSTIGDIVWLSSLQTEMNLTSVRDKHPEFFLMTSALLTYIMKSKRNETIIESPFKNMTKSEVIALGLNIGITKEELKNTSSCYHEKFHNCGLCSTCFKRWISMINNNIEEDYVNIPYKNDYAQSIIKEAREAIKIEGSERFSLKRIEEMRTALSKVNISL